ncbi:putative lysine-specific demethylase JMJ16 [Aristolochia californica]|uniref:putative lysine-specific demethylase JMJ16 n=1 Tax=Aristolochia californica TaxID=171875 RepID=UPI0035DB41BF
MGTECIHTHVKEEKSEIPLVPPGFGSTTSFVLKKVREGMTPNMEPSHSSNLQMDNVHSSIITDDEKLTRTLRRKPWINYSEFGSSSEDESESEQFDQNAPPVVCLPKGVIRGCPECANCQKVTAKWRPEDALRPTLDEAPVFYPNEEEFRDTLKYIASIRSRAEPYGICRIVPPPSWNPPCPLKEKSMWENAKFATRIQRIDKLQNRISVKKMSSYNRNMMKKQRKRLKMGAECNTTMEGVKTIDFGHHNSGEKFGFEPGSLFTLEAFQKYADEFKEQYFGLKDFKLDTKCDGVEHQKQWEPSVENIEGEYWRLVEKPTEEIEVLYGADIETGTFGSGFPKSMSIQGSYGLNNQYVKSGWSLNNLSRLPGSLLAFESGDISGVQVPWLYVGMCFSSFCWHVEDHHFYSMNYMHWGAPKLWYGVPGKDALKLEEAMKKHLPDLFEEQTDLLHKLVTQLSPSILKSEGVPVYRCIQSPREFIVTFPRAYHSGFNCGFNCAEAVNVAPVDWLPHGQSAAELYRDQGRKTSVSHDKLLLGAAREAVRAHWELLLLRKNTIDNLRWKDVCGKDGILVKALKTRVEMEHVRRESLSSPSQSRKMDSSFDAMSERECIICFYDLHLSAAGCTCSPDRFVCLNHAKQLCKCPWSSRFFLFRYEISELNILMEALCGKLSAVHRWAYLDLGLTLSSFVTKDKSQEASPLRQVAEQKRQEDASNSSNSIDRGQRTHNVFNQSDAQFLQRGAQPFLSVLPSKEGQSNQTKHMKEAVCTINPPGLGGILPKIKAEKQESPGCPLTLDDKFFSKPSQDISTTLGLATSLCRVHDFRSSDATQMEMATSSSLGVGDVIVLSDDDGEKLVSKDPDISLQLPDVDDKVSTCNDQKVLVLNVPETYAAVMSEKDARLLPVVEKKSSLHPVTTEVEDFCQAKVSLEYNFIMPNAPFVRTPQNPSHNVNSKAVTSDSVREPSSTEVSIVGSHVKHPLLLGTGKSYSEYKNEGPEPGSGLRVKDGVGSLRDNILGSSNNLERHFHQKGPRIAKVVRRVISVVEPLQFGVVLSGKLWSNSQAIFPKGFRSRVQYLSVLEPTKKCYYVSEILDAGLLGPLFMVTVEQCPSEVFIHVSVTKCWDMVRERVNLEIRKQHNMGRIGLPHLQPPGCIDGLEMFGLTSPIIIQAIEELDRDHICLDYWNSSVEQKNSEPSPPVILSNDLKQWFEEPKSYQASASDRAKQSSLGAKTVLRGLFKKANLVELNTLHSSLSDDKSTSSRETVCELLAEEFHNRQKLNSSKLT